MINGKDLDSWPTYSKDLFTIAFNYRNSFVYASFRHACNHFFVASTLCGLWVITIIPSQTRGDALSMKAEVKDASQSIYKIKSLSKLYLCKLTFSYAFCSASSMTPLVTTLRVFWRQNKDFICLCHHFQFLPSRIRSELGIPFPPFIIAILWPIHTRTKRPWYQFTGANLMLTLNDERKERVQNILFCVENREDEKSFVMVNCETMKLYCIMVMIWDIDMWYELIVISTKYKTSTYRLSGVTCTTSH